MTGRPRTREFWTGVGTLQKNYEYIRLERYDTNGDPVYQTYTLRAHLDSRGSWDAQNLTTGQEYRGLMVRATDLADIAPPDFFADEVKLTFLDNANQPDSYMRFEGLDTPTRSFDLPPVEMFGSREQAVQAIREDTATINARFVADLRALESVSLANAGPIVVSQIYPSRSGSVDLRYTPDPNTAVTFGDLVNINASEFEYGANLNGTGGLFAGEDIEIILTDGDDIVLNGGSQNSGIGLEARSLTIDAGGGADIIDIRSVYHSATNDYTHPPQSIIIDAGEGDDRVFIGSGTVDDPSFVRVEGGDGNDSLYGTDQGVNHLSGDAGDDTIEGGDLADILSGGLGNDTIRGGDGTDTLIGGDGDDHLFGGLRISDLRDVLFGGAGNDSMDGAHGNDELHGGQGNDTALGGFGSDTVIGNGGDDLLAGGAGSDQMFGGPGNDTLNGGFGFDRLNGGIGADQFFHLGVPDHGSDWIQDYSAAQGDVLVFGQTGATRDQFQVNIANTLNAGAADVAEAFVIYRPTGQIMWALVDGNAQSSVNIQLDGQVFDLLA